MQKNLENRKKCINFVSLNQLKLNAYENFKKKFRKKRNIQSRK